MRLINCSNCFSALRCSDDGSMHSDRALHKAGRHLRGLTKAIFQRQSTTPASTASPSWMCSKVIGTKTYGYANDWNDTGDDPTRSSHRQFPIERKHKVKKRDLVKQLLIVEAGNFLLLLLLFYVSLDLLISMPHVPCRMVFIHRFYRQIQFNFNLSSECVLMEEEKKHRTRMNVFIFSIHWIARIWLCSMKADFFFLSAESFYLMSHADIGKSMNTKNSVRLLFGGSRCYIYYYFRFFNIRCGCVEYCVRYDGDMVRSNCAPDSLLFIHDVGQDMMLIIITERRVF